MERDPRRSTKRKSRDEEDYEVTFDSLAADAQRPLQQRQDENLRARYIYGLWYAAALALTAIAIIAQKLTSDGKTNVPVDSVKGAIVLSATAFAGLLGVTPFVMLIKFKRHIQAGVAVIAGTGLSGINTASYFHYQQPKTAVGLLTQDKPELTVWRDSGIVFALTNVLPALIMLLVVKLCIGNPSEETDPLLASQRAAPAHRSGKRRPTNRDSIDIANVFQDNGDDTDSIELSASRSQNDGNKTPKHDR